MVRLADRLTRLLPCVRRPSPNSQLGKTMIATTFDEPADSGRPEAVFISWLLWQPRGADLASEALKEVQKLARYEKVDPDIARLKALFASLAGSDRQMH